MRLKLTEESKADEESRKRLQIRKLQQLTGSKLDDIDKLMQLNSQNQAKEKLKMGNFS